MLQKNWIRKSRDSLIQYFAARPTTTHSPYVYVRQRVSPSSALPQLLFPIPALCSRLNYCSVSVPSVSPLSLFSPLRTEAIYYPKQLVRHPPSLLLCLRLFLSNLPRSFFPAADTGVPHPTAENCEPKHDLSRKNGHQRMSMRIRKSETTVLRGASGWRDKAHKAKSRGRVSE